CETNILDRDVVVEKSEFLCQRNLLFVPRIERQAKQIAQVLDHGASQPGMTLDLRRDGVQRIEKEMRVKLHAKCIQPRLGKAAFHSLQPKFAGTIVFVVLESLYHAKDDPIDDPTPQKAECVNKRKGMSQSAPLSQAEKDGPRNDHIEVEECKRYAREQMRENTHAQLVLFKGKPRVLSRR